MRFCVACLAVLGLMLAGCSNNADPKTTGTGEGISNGAANPDSDATDGEGQTEPGTDSDESNRSGPILRAPADSPATDARSGTPPADETGQIRILDWDQTLELVNRQRGKVVVVDVWSHDCTPCLRELPHFVALSKQYPERVVCIGFNVDYTGARNAPPESFREDVRATLARHNADFVNVISSVPSIEFFDSIELGGPPAVYVFDRSGNQVKRFENDNADAEFTYEKDVAPLVQTLLASGG